MPQVGANPPQLAALHKREAFEQHVHGREGHCVPSRRYREAEPLRPVHAHREDIQVRQSTEARLV